MQCLGYLLCNKHLTATEMPTIKTNKNLKNRKQHVLVRMWRNWNPQTLLVGMLNGAATMENSSEVPSNFTTHKPKGRNYSNVHMLIMNK